jgi:hypothetical protein
MQKKGIANISPGRIVPPPLSDKTKASRKAKKTRVLEAIADPDLYSWYYFFGEAGSLNDINILNKKFNYRFNSGW